MSYDEICNAVAEIKKKYDEKDPVRLCTAWVLFCFIPQWEQTKIQSKAFFSRIDALRP